MKQLNHLLLLACTICFSLQAHAQGRVNFSARVVGLYDAPVFDVDGVTKVSGPDFVAQMYAGPNEGSLAPIRVRQIGGVTSAVNESVRSPAKPQIFLTSAARVASIVRIEQHRNAH